MAEIECTVSEFHKFIGPKIRNDIQYMTKRRKRELKYRCEECGRERELHAAHYGSTRKKIIEKVLKRHLLDSGVIRGNLEEIRGEILAAHRPIESHMRFLCESCHRKFDANPSPSQQRA